MLIKISGVGGYCRLIQDFELFNYFKSSITLKIKGKKRAVLKIFKKKICKLARIKYFSLQIGSFYIFILVKTISPCFWK